jgi:membrane-associated phospholipid phosphatase
MAKNLQSTVLARIISFIANPIFILIGLPLYLVYETTADVGLSWRWTLYTWVYLFVFGAFVLYGVRKKIFTDIDVSVRSQRPLLYSAGAILSLLYLVGLIVFNGPFILLITIIGILISIALGSFVNSRLKISVHAASASALFTLLAVAYRGFYVLLLLLIPVICWARVRIRRHTVSEVVAGSLMGSFLSLIMYFVVRNFIFL